jgi:hypothetical protein
MPTRAADHPRRHASEPCYPAPIIIQHLLQSGDLGELEDLRQLYAHNYAGEADDVYFERRRHVLAPSRIELTCGAEFNGRQARLDLSHLRAYCGIARRVLEASLRPSLPVAGPSVSDRGR